MSLVTRCSTEWFWLPHTRQQMDPFIANRFIKKSMLSDSPPPLSCLSGTSRNSTITIKHTRLKKLVLKCYCNLSEACQHQIQLSIVSVLLSDKSDLSLSQLFHNLKDNALNWKIWQLSKKQKLLGHLILMVEFCAIYISTIILFEVSNCQCPKAKADDVSLHVTFYLSKT